MRLHLYDQERCDWTRCAQVRGGKRLLPSLLSRPLSSIVRAINDATDKLREMRTSGGSRPCAPCIRTSEPPCPRTARPYNGRCRRWLCLTDLEHDGVRLRRYTLDLHPSIGEVDGNETAVAVGYRGMSNSVFELTLVYESDVWTLQLDATIPAQTSQPQSSAAAVAPFMENEAPLATSGQAPPGSVHRELGALSAGDEANVTAALLCRPGFDDEKLVEYESIPVTRASMRTLCPTVWLNDEARAQPSTCRALQCWSRCISPARALRLASVQVINVFMALLASREKTKAGSLPKCYFAKTNFYTRLAEGANGYCYKNVCRWTKKVRHAWPKVRRHLRRCLRRRPPGSRTRRRQEDVFAMDLVIVPIHCHGNHWTLAVINFKQRRFEYYDSLRGGPDVARADAARILAFRTAFMLASTQEADMVRKASTVPPVAAGCVALRAQQSRLGLPTTAGVVAPPPLAGG